MEWSEIISIVLGGGLVTTLVAIANLKSTVKKATAEAEKVKAEAETVHLDNAEHATRILVENIVTPLKEELNETRKYLEAAKREMARLRKAIDTANSCRHHDDCPVLLGLREQPKGDKQPARHETRGAKHEDGAADTADDGGDTAERGHADPAGGEPAAAAGGRIVPCGGGPCEADGEEGCG